MTMLKLADELGPVLTTRSLAEELRERVETLADGGDVVLDFEGVEAIAPSFADELFAKLPPALTDSGRVRYENLSDDLLALARFVVANRTNT
jgi:STAS-like domain of unknown function (DUF4325)